MSERVGIVAVAQTKFSPKRGDVNVAELAYEVIERVLNETGLKMERDIDNSISCSHDIWDGQTISNIGITDVIGGHLRTEEKMAMDGSTAVYYGAIGILSGEFECTLLLAHTKMSQTDRNVVNNDAFEPIFSRMLGLDFTSAAALQCRRYMERFGITEEQLAMAAVKNLANASKNPSAYNFGNYSVNDILKSAIVASPIHEMEMAPDTDGAVAMIIASEKRAKKITKNPVWINGIGTCYDAYFLGDRDLTECTALRRAAAKAYKMAGIDNPLKQVDLVELSDEFSYQELLWCEGLGLCDLGEGGKLVESGMTMLGGRIPVNPSGGLLGGVPANVMGLNRVAEAALQIMEVAEDRQVEGARTAVAQGHSGFCGQHHCVIVLGK